MVENENLTVAEAEPPTEAVAVVEDAPEAVEAAEAPEQTDAAPADTGQATLTVKRQGMETDSVFTLNPPSTIGRFDPNVGPIDVDLADLPEGVYVSRKHAKITCEDGVWKLVDLGSSNGTFVLRDDFERVDEAELADGTEFALGNARFIFKLG